MDKDARRSVEEAVSRASAGWVQAFNRQDSDGCASFYEPTAVMNATPFGRFEGRTAIREFWKKLHDDGFADVEYVDPTLDVIDARSAVVTSKWRMNKAHGVITRELWVIQDDGSALLREDDFEALG